MPRGKQKIKPKKETINVKDKPPQAFVSTHSRPNEPPDIKKYIIKNNFKERVFTMNDLPSFKHYRIKLIMTSTDQVYVPRVRDLRVLALA